MGFFSFRRWSTGSPSSPQEGEGTALTPPAAPEAAVEERTIRTDGRTSPSTMNDNMTLDEADGEFSDGCTLVRSHICSESHWCPLSFGAMFVVPASIVIRHVPCSPWTCPTLFLSQCRRWMDQRTPQIGKFTTQVLPPYHKTKAIILMRTSTRAGILELFSRPLRNSLPLLALLLTDLLTRV